MSDRSSNMEIQDVLTSIRRLVSEDKNLPDAGETDDVNPPAAEEPQDKLVLTPAHRVQEDSATTANEDQAPPEDSASLEETIAELEAAVAVNGGDFEPDGSEVEKPDPADADPDLERAFEDSFGVDLAADDDRQSDLSRPVTSGQMDDGGEEGEAADAHAEVETAGTGDAEEGSEDALRADAGADTEGDADDVSGPAPETGAAAVEMPSPEQVDALIAAGTAAAANAAAARRLNLGAGDLIRDGRAPWGRSDAPERDDAEADAGQPETASTAGPSTLDLQAEADAQLLREIVADIVRQELQGPLGERITRSVRMLVRREINRALESRDFE